MAQGQRRVLRREVGLGAGELLRVQRAAAGDESLRPRGWAGQHWSPAIGAEHLGTREAAGLFDESSFAKIEVSGPGAAELLERLCDNRVARGVGQITYTQMLNSRGGIECDFTVTRVDEEEFSIVTGTAFGNHDLAWIRRHAPEDGSVRVADVTSRWACYALWGPKAREILAPLTPQGLDDEAFPYMSMRELAVGDVPVRALRVTFVGELGWELYCPSEYGLGLWQTLWEAGRPHGLVAGGYRAIDTMRLEKGYRVWAADITPDEHPLESGLGFCVKLEKEGGFIGRDALAEIKERGPSERRLCCLTLADPRSVALGNEPVRVGGEVVGRVTSGGYGFSVERSIAYAWMPAEHADRARRSPSTSSARGSRARSPASRCSIPRGSGSEERLDRHVEHDQQQQGELDARREEEPVEDRGRCGRRRSLRGDELPVAPRLGAQVRRSDDEREDPHAQAEGHPEVAERPVALVDHPEAQADQDQGGRHEHPRAPPLDVGGQRGEEPGVLIAPALRADHERLDEHVAAHPDHRAEDVEGQQPLVLGRGENEHGAEI